MFLKQSLKKYQKIHRARYSVLESENLNDKSHPKRNNFPLSFALSSVHFTLFFHFIEKLFALNKLNDELNICVATFILIVEEGIMILLHFIISIKT